MTTDRLLFGLDSNGDPKVRLAKAGYDAVTDEDNSHYIFSSDFNLIRIAATGVVTLTIPNGETGIAAQVTHGLSVIPMVLWAILDGSYQRPISEALVMTELYGSSDGVNLDTKFKAITRRLNIQADSEHVHFQVTRPGTTGAETYYVRYYILYETAATS